MCKGDSGNWELTGGWMRVDWGYVCMKCWSVLSNDEKVWLQTFITMKVSTLDLSSEFKKKKCVSGPL